MFSWYRDNLIIWSGSARTTPTFEKVPPRPLVYSLQSFKNHIRPLLIGFRQEQCFGALSVSRNLCSLKIVLDSTSIIAHTCPWKCVSSFQNALNCHANVSRNHFLVEKLECWCLGGIATGLLGRCWNVPASRMEMGSGVESVKIIRIWNTAHSTWLRVYWIIHPSASIYNDLSHGKARYWIVE